MKPIDFKEANRTLGKPKNMTDEECNSLRVFTDGEQCLSCWQMTIKERLAALLFGRIWVDTLSGSTQPPMWLQCKRNVFEDNEKE